MTLVKYRTRVLGPCIYILGVVSTGFYVFLRSVTAATADQAKAMPAFRPVAGVQSAHLRALTGKREGMIGSARGTCSVNSMMSSAHVRCCFTLR